MPSLKPLLQRLVCVLNRYIRPPQETSWGILIAAIAITLVTILWIGEFWSRIRNSVPVFVAFLFWEAYP